MPSMTSIRPPEEAADRRAGSHRLQGDDAERLVEAGDHGHAGLVEQVLELVVGDEAGEVADVGHAGRLGRGPEDRPGRSLVQR